VRGAGAATALLGGGVAAPEGAGGDGDGDGDVRTDSVGLGIAEARSGVADGVGSTLAVADDDGSGEALGSSAATGVTSDTVTISAATHARTGADQRVRRPGLGRGRRSGMDTHRAPVR
jgi:hypothetical protein